MSSKSDKPAPSSERPGENVSPAVAAARLIRSRAFSNAKPESTGTFSPIVDKLDYDEADTTEMLPDDMTEADVAQGFYGADATDASPDSSAIEDELIKKIDSQKGDAEDTAALRTETVRNSESTQYHTEDLVPGGAVKVRRKVSDETVA